MMPFWIVTIGDYSLCSDVRETFTDHGLHAPTAADAATIARLRYGAHHERWSMRNHLDRWIHDIRPHRDGEAKSICEWIDAEQVNA